MPITNASKVYDLVQLGTRTTGLDERHKIRVIAILGEKSAPERVGVMLEHNIKMFNDATNIEENEKYLVAMIEAMFEANIDDTVEIANSAIAMLFRQRHNMHREYYPHVILALLHFASSRDKATAWKDGKKIPSIIGRMFRDIALAANEKELRVSTWMTGQLSHELLVYLKDPEITRGVIAEIKDISRVQECLHGVFGDLTHRLFATLSFTERLSTLGATLEAKAATRA